MTLHRTLKSLALLLLATGLGACTINGIDDDDPVDQPTPPAEPETGLFGQWVELPLTASRSGQLRHVVMQRDGRYHLAVTECGAYQPLSFYPAVEGSWSDYDPQLAATADSGAFTVCFDEMSYPHDYHFLGDTLLLESRLFGSRLMTRAEQSPYAWEPVMSVSVAPRNAVPEVGSLIIRAGDPYDVNVRTLIPGHASKLLGCYLHLTQPDYQHGGVRHDTLDVMPLLRPDGSLSVPLQAPALIASALPEGSTMQQFEVEFFTRTQLLAAPFRREGSTGTVDPIIEQHYTPVHVLVSDFSVSADLMPSLLTCQVLNVQPMLPGSRYSMADVECTFSSNVEVLTLTYRQDGQDLNMSLPNRLGQTHHTFHLESLDLSVPVDVTLTVSNQFGTDSKKLQIN